MDNTQVFIHGLESTSKGTKGRYFREHFPDMIIEDFSGDFYKRMNKLTDILKEKNNLVIVGSSFGGAMAVQYAINNKSKVKKLILLAPAIHLPEILIKSDIRLDLPVIIYHGTNDIVVNPRLVKEISSKIFPNMEHHLVEDDHPLTQTFPILDWHNLLKAG